MAKKYYNTVEEIGELVRQTRKTQGITQTQLAQLAGTGARFISDLENGKTTCQLEKFLRVVHTLGLDVFIYSRWDRTDE